MTTDLASRAEELHHRVELARMLYTWVQTVRCSKRRPDLAAVAAELEIKCKRDLEDLEAKVRERELQVNEKVAA